MAESLTAILNFTEGVGKKVEEVGFKYVPGFDKVDKAMQVLANKLNCLMGLRPESSESGIISDTEVRSDML